MAEGNNKGIEDLNTQLVLKAMEIALEKNAPKVNVNV